MNRKLFSLFILIALSLTACGVDNSANAHSGLKGIATNSCTQNGVSYPVGSVVPDPQGCNTCSCQSLSNGGAAILCSQIACMPVQ